MTPLRGFSPDADPCTPGIMTACSNVVPFEAGFKGAPSAVATQSSALAAPCVGAAVVTQLSGSRRVLAGSAVGLYELSGSSWIDRTRAVGGAYIGGADTRWSFCQFGDTTVAANLADAMQSSTSGAFANIASAPKARIVVSASNNFVLAFHTSEATYGDSPDRWWCCAQNDQTSWTPSVSTGATTGRLVATEGPLQAALPLGDYVVAYKSRGIYLGTYVGAPVVWQWTLVPGGEAGAVGQEAVCDIGGAHFIVGNDAFWLFDGARPVPVGDGAVRKWWLDHCNANYRYRTKVTYDRQSNLLRIFYPSGDSSTCNACLVLHLSTKQWGRADVEIQAPLNYISPGATVDGMDSYGATIHAMPSIPLDSAFWVTGGQTPAYFDTTNQLVSSNGVCEESSFTTATMGDDDAVSLLERARVRFSAAPASASASGFYAMNLGDSLTPGPTQAMHDGKFDLHQTGRWHRVRFDMGGDYQATGYDAKLQAVGAR